MSKYRINPATHSLVPKNAFVGIGTYPASYNSTYSEVHRKGCYSSKQGWNLSHLSDLERNSSMPTEAIPPLLARVIGQSVAHSGIYS